MPVSGFNVVNSLSVDVSNGQHVEEMETAVYESRTDESLLIQQKPASRGKLEARMDSVRVYCYSSSCTSYSPTQRVQLTQKKSFLVHFVLCLMICYVIYMLCSDCAHISTQNPEDNS